MKGSPIVSTIIIIIALLGIYIGARNILPKEEVAVDQHEGHDHGGHGHDHGDHDHGDHDHEDHDHSDHDHGDHAEHTDHDDSSLETQFEFTFSTKPKSIKITQPSTKKEIINTTDLSGLEHLATANISLEGHSVELAVEIEWVQPQEMNIAIISISPARHGSKQATLKSESNIDDIAEFHW